MSEHWNIVREEEPNEIYYTVNWSPWGTMDRWVINRRVPAEAGLYQIWVRKSHNFLLLTTELSYFGGIRNSLREAIDELSPAGDALRAKMGTADCRFRFSTYPHREYLIELNDWFKDGGGEDKDGREIIVNEKDDLHHFVQPPPDLKKPEPNKGTTGFGPPLPPQGRRLNPPVWVPSGTGTRRK